MCEVVSMTLLMTASAMASVQAKQAQASAERQISAIATKQANRAASSHLSQLNEKVKNQRARVASELDVATRASVSRAATAAVSAGESGVAGSGTTSLLLSTYSKKRLEFETTKNLELDGIDAQAMFDQDAIEQNRQSIILSNTPTSSTPSFLGAALSIAGGAASGYAMGKDLQNATSGENDFSKGSNEDRGLDL